MAAAAHRRARARSRPVDRLRSGLLTDVLLCRPACGTSSCSSLPLAIVVVFSFGHAGQERRLRARASPSTTTPGRSASPDPFITSLGWRSPGRSCACSSRLPLAYFIATRAGQPARALFILLLVVPFWTSFLIRTYAWLIMLGPDGLAGMIGSR